MNSTNVEIQQLTQDISQDKESLAFLHRIISFQESLAGKVEAGLRITPDTAQEKWRAGIPLFAGETLSISPELFLKGMKDLRTVIPPNETAVALECLLGSSFMMPSNVESTVDDLIKGSNTSIQRMAEVTPAKSHVVAFLLHTVLSPFFQKQAEPYLEWVKESSWRRGICPICGSEPEMARLTQKNGKRILFCPLCYTEWPFDRLRCPFCESDGEPRLRYFTVNDDEAHRVYCCDKCHRYIKTVDERILGHRADLLVEDVITFHLDVMAEEQGFQ